MHSIVARNTYAAELVSLLNANNPSSLIQLRLHEIITSVRSAEDPGTYKRPIPMDGGVDAKAFDVSDSAKTI